MKTTTGMLKGKSLERFMRKIEENGNCSLKKIPLFRENFNFNYLLILVFEFCQLNNY